MSEHISYIPDEKYYYKYNKTWVNTTLNLIKSVIDPSDFNEKPKILDIGCGRGEILRELSRTGYDCFGVDFDEECVKLSRNYGNVFQADIKKIGGIFEKSFFDLVVMVHVLEHTIDPCEAIENVKRIAKKSIVIAVPNLCSSTTFWRGMRGHKPILVNKGHRFGWDPGHLKTFLEVTCNLRILRWEPDRVSIPSKISLLFKSVGVLDNIELKVLPRLFPLLSNSLIVLCEKVEDTEW